MHKNAVRDELPRLLWQGGYKRCALMMLHTSAADQVDPNWVTLVFLDAARIALAKSITPLSHRFAVPRQCPDPALHSVRCDPTLLLIQFVGTRPCSDSFRSAPTLALTHSAVTQPCS